MSHPIITQPLPHDLRNWSFQGMNCEGWDFSGRDIRGCDFSRAKLAGANFRGVIAGRSQEQNINEIKWVIFLLPLSTISAALVALFIIGNIVSPIDTEKRWHDNLAFAISIAIAFTVEAIFIIPNSISAAMMSFEQGNIQYGFGWSVASVVILVMALVMASQAVTRFKIEPGTNFYSADLEGASFRNATLSSCNFDVACVKDVDWSNMTD